MKHSFWVEFQQANEYDLKEVFQLFFVEEWENTGDNGDIDCMV